MDENGIIVITVSRELSDKSNSAIIHSRLSSQFKERLLVYKCISLCGDVFIKTEPELPSIEPELFVFEIIEPEPPKMVEPQALFGVPIPKASSV